VSAAATQPVNQPGIHCAESQRTCCRLAPRSLDVVEQPAHLCAREVGIGDKPCLAPDNAIESLALQSFADGRRSPALPDDRVVNRLVGTPIPDDRRLALIGDADGRNLLRFDASFGKRLASDR